MARACIFVCVALATFSHFCGASSTGVEVIGTNLGNISSSAQHGLVGLIQSVQSASHALAALPDTNRVIILLDGLTSEATDLADTLQPATIDLLKGAINAITDAEYSIKMALLKPVSTLRPLDETLGDLLRDVHGSVNQLPSLTINLLGGVSGKLDTAIDNVLVSLTLHIPSEMYLSCSPSMFVGSNAKPG